MECSKGKYRISFLLLLFLSPMFMSCAAEQVKADPYLQYKWNIKRVLHVKDKSLKFIPKHFSHIWLSENKISGSDGVNSFWGSVTYFSDSSVKLGPQASTLVGGETDPIHLHKVNKISWNKKTHILHLMTPTEIYEFERVKFSRLSRSWSLAEIKNTKTGKIENVDRFRNDYLQLLIRIDNDKTFVFNDMNRSKFFGTIKKVEFDLPTFTEKVSKVKIEGMTFNEADQKRLKERKVKMVHHSDSENGYKDTKEKYEHVFAHRVDWKAVTYAEVGSVLKFYTPEHIYTFNPR